MKQLVFNAGKIFLGLLLVVAAIVLVRLGWAKVQVEQTAVFEAPIDTNELGETTSLSILPLYEEAAINGMYEQGHGVSYLIRTDETTILMDLGHNPTQSNPAPLLINMNLAGIPKNESDLLFISHNHLDHVGGLQEIGFFADSGKPLLMPPTIYAPQPMTILGTQAQVAEKPQALAPGVVSLGQMPFVQPFPFWLWQPLAYEQVLAVNVSGQGIVLITGCGHPTLERIVTQAEALFTEPVVGIVGGLHYEGVTSAELEPHVQFMAEREPKMVALSPHDNGTVAIQAFQEAFPTAYQTMQVGKTINFETLTTTGYSKLSQ